MKLRWTFLIIVISLVSITQLTMAMSLKKVHKNVYMVRGADALPGPSNKGFMSCSYGILTKEGWVVIDALATPRLSSQFVGLLKKVNKTPVKYLIITHYHQDHLYGASTYKKLGTKIIAHSKLKAYVESDRAGEELTFRNKLFKGIYKNVKLVSPNITIDKNDKTIKVGGLTFTIIPATPAHTNTDLIIYMPKEQLLFAGDMVVKKGKIPNVADKMSSSKGFVRGLKKMQKLKIKKIFTGHSYPLKADSIDHTLKYIKNLRDNVSKLKDRGLSYDRIKKRLKMNFKQKTFQFAPRHNSNIYKVFNDLDTEDMTFD